jgi:transposase InsO family protein
VSRYIDEHRGRFGVEPICRTLGVSASAYYHRKTGEPSDRVIDDERLLDRIRDVHAANYHAYGYRRTWKALLRAGEQVGRDRVKRLMRTNAIQGAKRRGKPWRTTISDPAATRLELAIVQWVAWFNHARLHESLGDRPPAEIEALYAARSQTTISL